MPKRWPVARTASTLVTNDVWLKLHWLTLLFLRTLTVGTNSFAEAASFAFEFLLSAGMGAEPMLLTPLTSLYSDLRRLFSGAQRVAGQVSFGE